jgi:hypothetical protein
LLIVTFLGVCFNNVKFEGISRFWGRAITFLDILEWSSLVRAGLSSNKYISNQSLTDLPVTTTIALRARNLKSQPSQPVDMPEVGEANLSTGFENHDREYF